MPWCFSGHDRFRACGRLCQAKRRMASSSRISWLLCKSCTVELPFSADQAICRMLGSWFFWYCTRTDSSQEWVARLVQVGLPASATSLMVTVLSAHEYTRFFAFCIFEMALGAYFPAMGLLKSRIVQDSSRGWIYALMRMPLNVFVMAVLCSTEEGERSEYRASNGFADGAQTILIGSNGSSPVVYCCCAPQCSCGGWSGLSS